MRIAVAGTGMYVTGRGGPGQGTLLASLAEAAVEGRVEEALLVGRSDAHATWIAQRATEICTRIRSPLRVRQIYSGRSDYRQTLTETLRNHDCDALIVSTPDETHHEIIKAGLLAGCHVLVVKPFVTSVVQARELIGLADQLGLFGAVEYHKRHDESNLAAKKALDGGILGNVSWIEVSYSQRIGIPRDTFRSWSASTNIFQYLGVHYVDLVEFLTGYRAARLAAMPVYGALRRLGLDTPDSVHVLSEWRPTAPGASPFVATFSIGWVDPDRSPAVSLQRMRIVGDAGRIECDQTYRGLLLMTADGNQMPNPYFSDFVPDPDRGERFQGYGYRSVRRFIDDVRDIRQGRRTARELRDIRPSFAAALHATAILEAARISISQHGAWQDVLNTPAT